MTGHWVTVAGARIRYEIWGEGDHDLVLIHGRGAHLRWWHAVTPLLAEHWRLIVLDLSGHGDSDHRGEYTTELSIAEVFAVAEKAGAQRPTLVGHSAGGRVALAAALAQPDACRSIITLDSRIRPSMRPFEVRWLPDGRGRVHASRDALAARFHLAPPQPEPEPEVMLPVVEYAMTRRSDGWTWKLDPRRPPAVGVDDLEPRLSQLRVPWGFVYAGLSALDPTESLDYLMHSPTPGGMEIVRLHGAHHHLVLDAPQETAVIIDRLARELPRMSPGTLLSSDRRG